ncbi:MAG: hypothetical protein J7L79_01490 [Thaumarchaeota archaeon]|nr:hypothetical protein [Nitrososphaerota archaeon]
MDRKFFSGAIVFLMVFLLILSTTSIQRLIPVVVDYERSVSLVVLDMIGEAPTAKRARRMRKVMERISVSLRPAKRRIFPELKPISEEYLKEAD